MFNLFCNASLYIQDYWTEFLLIQRTPLNWTNSSLNPFRTARRLFIGQDFVVARSLGILSNETHLVVPVCRDVVHKLCIFSLGDLLCRSDEEEEEEAEEELVPASPVVEAWEPPECRYFYDSRSCLSVSPTEPKLAWLKSTGCLVVWDYLSGKRVMLGPEENTYPFSFAVGSRVAVKLCRRVCTSGAMLGFFLLSVLCAFCFVLKFLVKWFFEVYKYMS